MSAVIEFLKKLLAAKFTGKVLLHFNDGVIKKVEQTTETKIN